MSLATTLAVKNIYVSHYFSPLAKFPFIINDPFNRLLIE